MQAFREHHLSGHDGTPLFARDVGSGLPLALCDGIVCDGFIWRYLIRDFRDRCRLVHSHYRGHGRSSDPADLDAATLEDVCADLAAVLDALDVQSAVLVGHSMGVQVGLEFYRRHPERVRGLVLICGSYGRILHTFHSTDILRWVVPLLGSAVSRWPRELQRLWSMLPVGPVFDMARLLGEVNPALTRRDDLLPYLRHLPRVSLRLFVTMLEDAGRRDAWDLLPLVEVPTLVVAGELDTFTPPYLAEAMARRIPGAEYLLVRGGSHVAPIEVPDLVDLRIEKFLLDRVARPGEMGLPARSGAGVAPAVRPEPLRSGGAAAWGRG